MKLKDMVELLSNNDACVVLKVKDGQEMNLISLGCFNGDEVMMRLTKGRDVTCTLFRKNGKSFSWHWGASGFTLVTDQVWRMGQLIQSCIENDFDIKCKAVYPTSAMGMTKAYMEKLAMQKAADQNRTEICVTRFGNLVASRGSAVPLFIEQVQNGMPITITDPEMTRFMMTVRDATDLVEQAFMIGENGDLLVKRSKACTTGDLAKAVCRYLNLPADYQTEIIGIRPGEKMHEALLTEEEAYLARMKGDYMVVSHKREHYGILEAEYRSDLAERMSADDVLRLIESVFEEGAER